jgi:hypothetical protein
VLVVPVQDPDARACLQKLPWVEDTGKILWAEVRKESGRGKGWFKIRDHFVNTRCSQPVLDFLSTTDVGRRVPPPAEDDTQSEASERELRERSEKREARRREAEELGIEDEERPLFLPTPSCRRGVGGAGAGGFPLSFLCYLLCYFTGALYLSWDKPGRRAKRSLRRAAFARTADRKRTVCISP